jgi:5'-phosphate synthase pdxT subunit
MAILMKIGVLALQGDVSEHVAALEMAMAHLSISGSIIPVRRPPELEGLAGLLMPGGESTTIAKQLDRFNLRKPIIDMANSGTPLMGTCAGCILLSSEILDQGKRPVQPLGLMDISVRRNAWGRQAESFEMPLKIQGLDSEFHGIFIRAPRIERIGADVKSLAHVESEHVMVRQKNMLALTFHPELSHDSRVHALFLGMLRL